VNPQPQRRSPRVLFAVTEDWYFWSHRKPLSDYLQKLGYKIVLAARFSRYESYLAAAGIRGIRIPFERSLKRPWQDFRAIIGLWTAVRSEHPDIVHLVSLKPILLSCLALVTHRHIHFIAAFTGMGYLFSSSDRSARWLRWCLIIGLRLLLRRPNVWIIVQNPDDLALLQTHKVGIPDRIRLIPGVGVDTSVFTFSELKFSGPCLVILPARLIRDKGIEEFVEAARKIKQSDPTIRFVVVGAEDPDNPASIESSVVDRWLRKGIIEWWGHRDDMTAVYQQARIVCLPSYREGMPKVLLEAAACGRPLVASDVAGCREVCRHGVNGTLVPPRASDELATAILNVMSSSALQVAYGTAGRRIVESEYSIEQIGQQTHECYENILSDHAGGK
tara:strand:- start:2226 stop:3392 length:1167 start_codon:yes stop_codon:yes gene_type:complete